MADSSSYAGQWWFSWTISRSDDSVTINEEEGAETTDVQAVQSVHA
jgi:hypothetical protein